MKFLGDKIFLNKAETKSYRARTTTFRKAWEASWNRGGLEIVGSDGTVLKVALGSKKIMEGLLNIGF